MRRTIKFVLIFVFVAVGCALMLVFGTLISGSWVTPPEKKAIQQALVEIDGVRQYRGVESASYQAQLAKVRAALEVCRRREISEYDGQIVPLVEFDLDQAIAERKAWQLPDSDLRKAKMLKAQAEAERFTERSIREKIQ